MTQENSSESVGTTTLNSLPLKKVLLADLGERYLKIAETKKALKQFVTQFVEDLNSSEGLDKDFDDFVTEWVLKFAKDGLLLLTDIEKIELVKALIKFFGKSDPGAILVEVSSTSVCLVTMSSSILPYFAMKNFSTQL